MKSLTCHRQLVIRAIPVNTLISRTQIIEKVYPTQVFAEMAGHDQAFLKDITDLGLIEIYKDPKGGRFLYRRLELGTQLLSIVENLNFDLTQRRLRILQVLSEKFSLNRREICEFLNPDSAYKTMSTSDQTSLRLLEESGFIEKQNDLQGHQKFVYSRTAKGTELLSILGIEEI